MGQRIINKEVDKRVVIKPNKTIKRIKEGVHGIMWFGENNDYPQVMEKLINGSVTAKACAGVYSKFLSGAAFENEAINKIIVGRDSRGKKITLQGLLRQVATSIAKNQGAYIHCNFDYEQNIVSTHLKPFKDCRFALPDDTNYSAKILTYDNWQKDKDIGKYDTNKMISYNVFNTKPEVFKAQIKEVDGEITQYKGQIYFLFTDDEYFYPLSTFDTSYLDCDTEAQLALFRNRQTRNGFFKKTILRIQEDLGEGRAEELAESARESLGVDGDGLWIITDQLNEDGEFSERQGFAIDQIDSNLDDEKFQSWDPKIANNIRKDAKGIPQILIDYEEGKMANTSGKALVDAANYYNAVLKDERSEIEDSFAEIFVNFKNPILKNNTNWKIKPLNLIEQQQDGINNINTTE